MRDRLALLRALREARWPLTATLGTVLLLQALMPAATAVTMAALVGTLEQHGGTAGLFGRAARRLVAGQHHPVAGLAGKRRVGRRVRRLRVRQPARARAAPMRRSWAVAPPRANSLCFAATK
jgi:hypothetical protein